MSLRQGMPVGAGCVFREDFLNTLAVSEQEGIITGTPIVDRRFEAVGTNTDMVQYGGNVRNLLCGVTQATWNVRFRTPTNIANDTMPFTQYTSAASGRFYMDCYGGFFDFGLVNEAAGTNRVHRYIPGLVANTEYNLTITYNGTTAAVIGYLSGLPVVLTSIVGAMPARLSIGYTGPLEIFSWKAGAEKYSQSGAIVRSLKIFNFEMTAEEALDLYQQDTMQEISP